METFKEFRSNDVISSDFERNDQQSGKKSGPITRGRVMLILIFVFILPFFPLLITGIWNWWEAWVYAFIFIGGFLISRILAVRHPGYAGTLLAYLGIPLFLDSIWAFVPAILLVILIILRTAMEDRVLQEKLKEHKEYTYRVRYRLFPLIW